MSDSAQQPSTSERPQSVGHETSDVSPLTVGLFALGLTLMIALVLPLLTWMFQRFEAAAQRADPLVSPLAGDQSPPEPRLETTPSDEIAGLRRAEDEKLSSYEWIDQGEGVVRVPVERAIEVLAERGFPEPEQPAQPEAKKEQVP